MPNTNPALENQKHFRGMPCRRGIGLTDADEYPHESEVRVKLMEWGRWRAGELATFSSVSSIAWDELTAISRELKRSDFRMPIIERNAELTNRTLRALYDQSSQQHDALLHYHFKTTSLAAIARVVRIRTLDIGVLLRHAHDNFHHSLVQLSIKSASSFAN